MGTLSGQITGFIFVLINDSRFLSNSHNVYLFNFGLMSLCYSDTKLYADLPSSRKTVSEKPHSILACCVECLLFYTSLHPFSVFECYSKAEKRRVM